MQPANAGRLGTVASRSKRGAVAAALCWIVGLPFAAHAVSEPQEAGVASTQAVRAAQSRDWAGALDSFGVYIEKLTLRHGRDRMLLGWILDEYVRTLPVTRNAPDLEPFASIVDEKIEESAERPLMLWRLYVLKADIARLSRDLAAHDAALKAAIDAYPEVAYPDPASQSYLHTLYNEAAFSIAAHDLPKAEATILQQFQDDRRFVYFDIEPWRTFHRRTGNPHRTADLARKVLDAYQAKIDAFPDLADTLTWYRLQLVEVHGRFLQEKLEQYQ